MEVPCHAQHDGLTVFDTLRLICPLAREFERGFNSLRPSVHGQDHVIAEKVGDLLREAAEHRVVERARRQRELLRLLDESRDNPRVAVTLSSGLSEPKRNTTACRTLRIPG